MIVVGGFLRAISQAIKIRMTLATTHTSLKLQSLIKAKSVSIKNGFKNESSFKTVWLVNIEIKRPSIASQQSEHDADVRVCTMYRRSLRGTRLPAWLGVANLCASLPTRHTPHARPSNFVQQPQTVTSRTRHLLTSDVTHRKHLLPSVLTTIVKESSETNSLFRAIVVLILDISHWRAKKIWQTDRIRYGFVWEQQCFVHNNNVL